jgi:hypothetical protein
MPVKGKQGCLPQFKKRLECWDYLTEEHAPASTSGGK